MSLRSDSVLSMTAQAVHTEALRHAEASRTCYPNWRVIEQACGLDADAFMDAFDELCAVGIVFSGFPSVLVSASEQWPLAPMYGSISSSRPSGGAWEIIRQRIFMRDDYTCQYCGDRGVRLECDHIVPVSRGGNHLDSNLTTACFDCNRSKRDKLLTEWTRSNGR